MTIVTDAAARAAGRIENMPDWVWLIVFFAVWLLLTQWLLPKLGVPT